MKKTILALTVVALLSCTGDGLNAQPVLVHTQDQMNQKPHELNSHAGDESWSSLEQIYSCRHILSPSLMMPSGIPESQATPWYPRVKSLPDGSYIMFYMGGQIASRLFCAFSTDWKTWTGRIQLATPKEVVVNGLKDYERYCNADAVVLSDGSLFAVYAFRAGTGYHTGQGCGIMAISSSDNGRSWTSPEIIYNGPCWEPYPLQLPDGRIQVYFTDSKPMTRNSGTSLIESTDGGLSFGPKKRISRQFKYYEYGERIYSDQMPVFRMLNDGRTLFGLVEDRHELDGPGTKSSYWLSLVYNDGPDWKDLGEDAAGPERKEENVLKSNSGYVVTLPSGEVVISTGYEGWHSVKIGDHTATKWNARNWMSDWYQPFRNKGIWGSIEATLDNHHIISTMDSRDRGILFTVSHLNHRIAAEHTAVTVDGDASEWKGDEALFIGSDSPVETIFRTSVDGDCLYIAVECLDEAAEKGASVNISLCNSEGKLKKGNYANITVSAAGLESSDVQAVKAVSRSGASRDGRKGYVCEIAIPLSEIRATGDKKLFFNARVSAVVDAEKVNDGFWMAGKNPESWQLIHI